MRPTNLSLCPVALCLMFWATATTASNKGRNKPPHWAIEVCLAVSSAEDRLSSVAELPSSTIAVPAARKRRVLLARNSCPAILSYQYTLDQFHPIIAVVCNGADEGLRTQSLQTPKKYISTFPSLKMKTEIFAVLSALAAIAIAAPQHHQIKISGTTAAVPASATFEEICWRVCAPQKIECKDEWYSKDLNGCWTCCKESASSSISSTTNGEEIDIKIRISGTTADDALTTQSIPSSPNKEIDIKIQTSETTSAASSSLFEDECWKLCFSDPIFKCLDKWHAKKVGSCWTCCKDTASPSISSGGEEIEVKIQISETTTDDAATPLSIPSTPSKEIDIEIQSSGTKEICLRVCFPEGTKCEAGMYPKVFNDCLTCCEQYESDSNAAKTHPFGLPADL
ncbi:hypothetical protein V501_03691 [Pseudogymnoascus sp. VKM F-4519 (FW-2642)]|nr:hypothetical protein V501_03691 [Pseudogymnoascus sp. VKM F-4519 (FW-2642)]